MLAASQAKRSPPGSRSFSQISSPSKGRRTCRGTVPARSRGSMTASISSPCPARCPWRDTVSPVRIQTQRTGRRRQRSCARQRVGDDQGGDARYAACTFGWIRPSKLRLPDSTAAATSLLPRSPPPSAWGSGRTCHCTWCSRNRRHGSRARRETPEGRSLEYGRDDLTAGRQRGLDPRLDASARFATALRASRPAAIMLRDWRCWCSS